MLGEAITRQVAGKGDQEAMEEMSRLIHQRFMNEVMGFKDIWMGWKVPSRLYNCGM